MRINSSDNKCFKSALRWPALLLFSHMMDKVKANKVLNEMMNTGFEKMRWLFLESIVEDIVSHAKVLGTQSFYFNHGHRHEQAVKCLSHLPAGILISRRQTQTNADIYRHFHLST